MLSGRRTHGERRLLEFKLPSRTDGRRAEQFLLQQQPGLCQRHRRPGVLRRDRGQRPVPATDADAESDLCAGLHQSAVLRCGLCVDRKFLLPRKPDDLDRDMLPER